MPTRSIHRPAVRRHTRGRWVAACATLAVVASALVATAATASATTHAACASPASGPSRVGRFAGIVHPLGTSTHCTPSLPAVGAEAPYGGTPPLINHGGPVMSTQSTGDEVVVTPVFWEPSGFTMTASYKNKITAYLDDLAADSGKLSNVFASTFQYSGSNGAINYKMAVGTPIDDTTALPADGCTLEATDTTDIYADSTGYSKCLDDAQVITETKNLVSAHSLPSDFGHLYVMLLPKHVESCFNAGATNTAGNFCTLNHQPSAAYCAYHSSATGTVYANMPFPAYESGTGFSCTAEGLGGGIQAPNGDPDADVEISPLSHEMAEAITDPLGNAWFDVGGNENGDDCAYIYGALSGPDGAHYNQTVNGAHYLTQEEFSNKDFVANTSGCVQGISAVTPTVVSLSSTSGPAGGGSHLTITGTGFPGATAVHFGGATATFSVLDSTHIDATVPTGTGTVDVTVTTAAATSATTALDQYTYTGSAPAPTVTGVSPSHGPAAGGQSVTITGTAFTAGSTVSIGGQAATSVVVGSDTQITATTPAHAAGPVDVLVTADGGTSTPTAGDLYVYDTPPVAPTVTGVSPASGPTAGGQSVTITGTAFTAGSTVSVGGQAATSVVVSSGTRITATTPAHAAGTVDVVVTADGGPSSTSAADHYTYRSRPSVTHVSPAKGPHAGGTKVTITGHGFVAGAVVKFGSKRGLTVTVVSSTKITVIAPKHHRGRVDLTVTTAGGTSRTRKADRYTFT